MSENLSKLKREKLLNSLQTINDLVIKNHPELSAQLREIYNEIETKQYGLIFEEYEESIDRILKDNIAVFSEDISKRIVKGDKFNFILEGDNLASLKILEKTHYGRIGVIYIDPPYNRGKNDFIYDDNYVGDDDYFKHSKWLSFMKKRLEIAKGLLTYDGVIFISIDDKEGFNLKLLCDDIFGPENLVSCMPRITKKSGKSTTTFSKNHDYVLVYVKNNTNIFVAEDHIDPGFKFIDDFVDSRGAYKLNQTLDYDTLGYVNSLDFPIEFKGRIYYPGSVSREEHLKRKQENPKDGHRWRWSSDLVKFGIENGWVEVNENTQRLYTKTYLKATIKKENGSYSIEYTDRTKPISSIDFINNEYSNDNARKELDSFGITEKFDYPKPSSLIKRLIKSYFDKDAIVLDFFAGSGTTAQAVMNLNAEDGGNRTFILCTNNQNGICENITYPRVKKVIEGFSFDSENRTVLYEKKLTPKVIEQGITKNEIDKIIAVNKSKFEKIEKALDEGKYTLSGVNYNSVSVEGVNESLKYFKVDFVNTKDRTYLDYSDDLLAYCKALVELQNGIDFDSNSNCILVLSDEEFDDLVSKISTLNGYRIFVGNNVLMGREQKEEILRRGNDLFILPDYFYKE
ncbi:MAG: site-specific DNA-methyltransferase [Flavobacteriales bacterium]|nr:site-specific DNA-methyltransferase [Flavobacteriales bacterium]